tara:strand:- start:181 stop:411 length:231 start_codon:yes stop_codon:yes gene_type:complete
MKNYVIYNILKMNKTKAKIKFKANSFDIIEDGDHVICAVSKKIIPLENLNYWNVELQEAYYSPIEVKIRFEEKKNN